MYFLLLGPIKNELFYTDVNTGRSLQLRTTHKNRDEAPIVGIKVSHLHQVVFLPHLSSLKLKVAELIDRTDL